MKIGTLVTNKSEEWLGVITNIKDSKSVVLLISAAGDRSDGDYVHVETNRLCVVSKATITQKAV